MTWGERGAPGCSKCRFKGCRSCFEEASTSAQQQQQQTATTARSPAAAASSGGGAVVSPESRTKSNSKAQSKKAPSTTTKAKAPLSSSSSKSAAADDELQLPVKTSIVATQGALANTGETTVAATKLPNSNNSNNKSMMRSVVAAAADVAAAKVAAATDGKKEKKRTSSEQSPDEVRADIAPTTPSRRQKYPRRCKQAPPQEEQAASANIDRLLQTAYCEYYSIPSYSWTDPPYMDRHQTLAQAKKRHGSAVLWQEMQDKLVCDACHEKLGLYFGRAANDSDDDDDDSDDGGRRGEISQRRCKACFLKSMNSNSNSDEHCWSGDQAEAAFGLTGSLKELLQRDYGHAVIPPPLVPPHHDTTSTTSNSNKSSTMFSWFFGRRSTTTTPSPPVYYYNSQTITDAAIRGYGCLWEFYYGLIKNYSKDVNN